MKKLYCILAGMIVCMAASAQSEGEHLKFMGLEIDGKVENMVSKLQQPEYGFEISRRDANIENPIMMVGEFAGYKDSMVALHFGKDRNVYEICVHIMYNYGGGFITKENRELYYELQKKLKYKYGKPEKTASIHYFDIGNYVKDFSYMTSWVNGVTLCFGTNGHLIIDYMDSVNLGLKAAQDLEEL